MSKHNTSGLSLAQRCHVSLTLSMSSVSQDSVQPVIIKEEGLEAFADHTSSDSVQLTEEMAQNNGGDPDYQVQFTITLYLVHKSPFLYFFFSLLTCLS